MSAVSGIGGVGGGGGFGGASGIVGLGGLGGVGALPGLDAGPSTGASATTGPILNEWMLRPQSFSADQVMDVRGAKVDAEKNTITYDTGFDFRGGGIGVDPIRDAIQRAAEEALRVLEAQQAMKGGLVGGGATAQPQGLAGIQLPAV
ncbi:MAG: hypothetical protein H7287_04710 [Thermoleophilia bacterium]|nr:hypothetical protein [Thermoleophilia bacterium]